MTASEQGFKPGFLSPDLTILDRLHFDAESHHLCLCDDGQHPTYEWFSAVYNLHALGLDDEALAEGIGLRARTQPKLLAFVEKVAACTLQDIADATQGVIAPHQLTKSEVLLFMREGARLALKDVSAAEGQV